jgi:hypothetical protein
MIHELPLAAKDAKPPAPKPADKAAPRQTE